MYASTFHIMHKRYSMRRPGFTLIELMIVVAIIAILISVLLPSLAAAREQARTALCLANLKEMNNAIIMYTIENSGYLPGPLHPAIYRETAGLNPLTEEPWHLPSRLRIYFGERDGTGRLTDRVVKCPTAERINPDDKFRDPSNYRGLRPFSYCLNTWLSTRPVQYFGWVNHGDSWAGWVTRWRDNPTELAGAPKKIEQVDRPGDEWAIGDAWWDENVAPPRPGSPGGSRSVTGTWHVGGTISGVVLPRKPYHNKGTNLAYFDGHAATFRGRWRDTVNPVVPTTPPRPGR